MQKSKLGLPVGITAAIMYLAGLFGGYFAALLAAGFILLVEDENFIRRSALKTLIILFTFSLLNVLVNLIPDVVGIFHSLLAIFRVHFTTVIIDNLNNVLSQTMNLLKTGILILLAVLALFEKSIDLKLLNRLVDK